MTRGVVVGLLALMAAAAPGPALAWTVASVQEACADDDLYYIYGACTGYLIGVADALSDGTVCLPAEGAAFVLEEAAAAVAAAKPEAGEAAPALVLRVLREFHPC
jgi:hypothetical protein